MLTNKKKFNNKEIILVYKHSRLSKAHNLDKKNENAIKRLKAQEENNLKTISYIEKFLKEENFSYKVLNRNKLSKEEISDNLVIAIGGDGTILDVSHFCDEAILLGVNSDLSNSIGALCASNKDSFKKIFYEVLKKKPPLLIWRIEIFIDDQRLDILALNDILFCHKNPSHMSRYYLEFNNILNEQRSSGLWVSTAIGSTGAIFSAGADLIKIDQKKLQFLVREPYQVSSENDSLWLFGTVKENEELSIKSLMDGSLLFVDGPHKNFPVPFLSTVKLKISKKPLMLAHGHLIKKRQISLVTNRISYRKISQK